MKKVMTFLVVSIFGMLLYSPAVYAAANVVDLRVETTNVQIDQMIDNAVYRADNTAENKDIIINNLVKVTDIKAGALESWANKKGTAVESEYVPVDIGGATILVDPCRVIGI